jgi:hypothetical protein
MSPRGSLRSAGWIAVLAACATLFVVLTFRVNAVKSEVRLAERRIVALQQEKMLLETEFETRASQQNLSNWNEVEFGYRAPRAAQYLENERQLASLGTPRAVGAPAPIRVASAEVSDDAAQSFPRMVSPVTGQEFAGAGTIASDIRATAAHERASLSSQITRNAARIVLKAGMEAGE